MTYTPRFPGDIAPGHVRIGVDVETSTLTYYDAWQAAGPFDSKTLGPTFTASRFGNVALARMYFGPTAATASTVIATCRAQVNLGRLPWISIKPNTTNTSSGLWTAQPQWVIDLIVGLKGVVYPTGHPLVGQPADVWLTVWHEPEAKVGTAAGKQGTAAQWKTQQQWVRSQIQAAGASNVAFAPIFEGGGTFNSFGTGTAGVWGRTIDIDAGGDYVSSTDHPNGWHHSDAAQWLIQNCWDFIGWDVYDTGRPGATGTDWTPRGFLDVDRTKAPGTGGRRVGYGSNNTIAPVSGWTGLDRGWGLTGTHALDYTFTNFLAWCKHVVIPFWGDGVTPGIPWAIGELGNTHTQNVPSTPAKYPQYGDSAGSTPNPDQRNALQADAIQDLIDMVSSWDSSVSHRCIGLCWWDASNSFGTPAPDLTSYWWVFQDSTVTLTGGAGAVDGAPRANDGLLLWRSLISSGFSLNVGFYDAPTGAGGATPSGAGASAGGGTAHALGTAAGAAHPTGAGAAAGAGREVAAGTGAAAPAGAGATAGGGHATASTSSPGGVTVAGAGASAGAGDTGASSPSSPPPSPFPSVFIPSNENDPVERVDIVICRKGSLTQVYPIPYSSASCSVVLNDFSEATVNIGGISFQRCCEEIAQFKPWEFEIAFLTTEGPLWAGPIVQRVWNPDGDAGLTISARDRSAWLTRRFIHQDHNFVQTDLATIYQAYALDAIQPDNGMNLQVSAQLTGILGDRKALAAQHLKADSELSEIATTGCDWYCLLETLHVGVKDVSVQTLLRQLTVQDLQKLPTITEDGLTMVNHWLVAGEGGGDAGDVIVGERSDAPSQTTFGLLEDRADVATIKDTGSAGIGAQTRLDYSKDVKAIGTEFVLATGSSFPNSELRPGNRFEVSLDSACGPMTDRARLHNATWDFAAADQGGGTTRTLTLIPEGTLNG